ncbi:MAG TPA: O-antigen ligase family protein [Armatimonadota bacterium]|jgi:O-antigen ligase
MDSLVAALLALTLLVSPPYSLGPLRDLVLRIEGGGGITLFDLAVAISALAMTLRHGITVNRVESKVYLGLLLVVLSRVISVLSSDVASIGMAFSVFKYVECILIVFVCSKCLRDSFARRLFLRILLVGTVVECLSGMALWLEFAERGIFLSTTNLRFEGLFICVVALSSLAGRWTLWRIAVFSTLLGGITASQTRSAAIVAALSVALGVVAMRGVKRWRIVAMAVILSVVIGGVVVYLPSLTGGMTSRMQNLTNTESGTTSVRLSLWARAVGIFLSHPLTGVGSGAFARLDPSDIDGAVQIPFSLAPEPSAAEAGLGTHSVLSGVLAETGILGLLAYLFWWFSAIRVCHRSLRTGPDADDQTVIVAVSCFCLISLFSDAVYAGSFEYSVMCLLGLLMGRQALSKPIGMSLRSSKALI